MRRTSQTMTLLTWLLAALTCAACAHTPVTTDHLFEEGPGTVVLSMPALTCQSCGPKVVTAVTAVEGVTEVVFAKDTVEVGVAFDPSVTTPEAILAAGVSSGEKVVLGSGQGSYARAVDHPAEYDVVIISRGEEVDFTAHLVGGKVTVVDFYADWCGPCRRVSHVMNAIMSERDDVALRKIDIVDWDTPVAQQHMVGIASLPYTIIYGKTGDEVRRIVGLDIAGLNAAIDAASGEAAPMEEAPVGSTP
jgi:thiol-disulfide isomerase/thioredoxin